MNKIPENWITYKISDLCDFQNGYAFNSSDYVEEGMPIIRMSNISIDGNLNLTSENTKYYPREKAEILKKYVLNKNDVVMAMTDMTKDMGIIGKTAIIDEDNKYLLNQRVGRLIIKNPKILDYKYLHRYTNSPRFLDYAKQHCSGGVQLNLSTKAILNHKIILPSTIEEQEEIAQVLDTMSDIIRLREECISHAQDLIPALFQEMFKQYIKQKDKHISIGSVTSDTKQINPLKFFETEFYYIDIASINNDTGIIETPKIININETPPSRARKLVQTNDVIISMTRPYLKGFSIIPKHLDGQIVSTGFSVLRSIPEKISPLYLFAYARTDMFVGQLISKMKGANYPAVRDSDVRSVKIPLPPIELQEQFAAKVEEINSYIKEQQEELENARLMFQSLLHHAFTGELTKHKYGEINE